MKAQRDQKTGKWKIQYTYYSYDGVRKKSTKRGFTTKREAETWAREFLLIKQADFNMRFEDFVNKIYFPDMESRLKENTVQTKKYIINDKVLTYFGNLRINDIKPSDIRKWQTTLIEKGYANTYLRTIQNQLTALFNYAVKFYDLKTNPCKKAGSMGKKEASEMLFWTKQEYLKFIDAVMDKPISFYAFEVLYWLGLRLGEFLSLTPADFDFKKQTISITKSYQRLKGEDVVTEPKTPRSNRVILMPDFLCEEMQEYLGMLYEIQPEDRIFTITKSYLHKEMDRGSKLAGVKRIRIHDLRHSHVSLLIEMGVSALAIAERTGHETIDIVYRYAHLFPTKQVEMVEKLSLEKGEY